MEARNRNNVSISSILLCISILIIIIMSLYIYNLNNEVINLKNEISKFENTDEKSLNSNKENKNKQSNQQISNNDSEFIGIWKTYDAINSETGEIITELSKVFGSSYLSFGSTLKLNEDGTFLDSIYPITSSEISIEGTYEIKRDLYKSGDCYILLTYSDKTEKTLIVTYENKIPILTTADENQEYQFDLKK